MTRREWLAAAVGSSLAVQESDLDRFSTSWNNGRRPGWYKNDAVGDLGRLSGELFRARRLVIDTGLQKWTVSRPSITASSKTRWTDMSVMPGRACSFKIGQLKILELRENARQALGTKFSLKDYHDVVLGSGSIPLTLLERMVKQG